jgi:hypothetical protein
LNAFERRKIAENTRRGMFGRAERGLATGGTAYGYRIATNKKIEIDPTAAEVVRRVFQLSADGEGRPPAQRGGRAAAAPAGEPRTAGVVVARRASGDPREPALPRRGHVRKDALREGPLDR